MSYVLIGLTVFLALSADRLIWGLVNFAYKYYLYRKYKDQVNDIIDSAYKEFMSKYSSDLDDDFTEDSNKKPTIQ